MFEPLGHDIFQEVVQLLLKSACRAAIGHGTLVEGNDATLLKTATVHSVAGSHLLPSKAIIVRPLYDPLNYFNKLLRPPCRRVSVRRP